MTYNLLVRPLLRFLDSESAHGLSLSLGSTVASTIVGQKLLGTLYRTPSLPVDAFGFRFRHPVGLAAGFDKKCEALSLWPSIGFSWTEAGGITYHPQEGNEKPRMFRADSDRALVNRMGFNNPGAVEARRTLQRTLDSGNWPRTPLAINIGCSKIAMNDNQPDEDYIATLQQLWDFGDIFVINVSSPNTPGLRNLGEEGRLTSLLDAIYSFRSMRDSNHPVLLKVSPDSHDDDIRMMVDIASSRGIDGFVAVNTTVGRPDPTSTRSRRAFSEEGGLSGRPLSSRSAEVINIIYRQAGPTLPIVGVGGIDGPETAWNAITNGATLLQLYSALVFNGPGVVKKIVRGLRARLDKAGIHHIHDAVGINVEL